MELILVLAVGSQVLAARPQIPARSRVNAREISTSRGFRAGLALYLPSPVYLSALQVVGTTKMDTAAMAVWVIIVIVLALLTVEVPVLLFLLAPGWTVPRLQAVNGWLDRDGHTLLVAVVGAIGPWGFIDGLVGVL